MVNPQGLNITTHVIKTHVIIHMIINCPTHVELKLENSQLLLNINNSNIQLMLKKTTN